MIMEDKFKVGDKVWYLDDTRKEQISSGVIKGFVTKDCDGIDIEFAYGLKEDDYFGIPMVKVDDLFATKGECEGALWFKYLKNEIREYLQDKRIPKNYRNLK